MDKIKKLSQILEDIQGDVEKFYAKGNNAAGTRIRKAMQDLKNLAQEVRVEIQSKKNG